MDLIGAKKVNAALLIGVTVSLDDTGEVISSMTSYDTVAMPGITRF